MATAYCPANRRPAMLQVQPDSNYDNNQISFGCCGLISLTDKGRRSQHFVVLESPSHSFLAVDYLRAELKARSSDRREMIRLAWRTHQEAAALYPHLQPAERRRRVRHPPLSVDRGPCDRAGRQTQ